MSHKVQDRMDWVTRRWWFYGLVFGLFFLGTYASEGYDRRQSIEVIGQALANPLIFAVPWLMPIAKAIPLLLILGVGFLGNRMRRAFNAYVAILYLALALFQTTAITEEYGFVIIVGNLALVLLLAVFWGWEAVVERNDFGPRKIPGWKWWVAPFALLALLSPVDTSTFSPDFNIVHLLTNEGGLTCCMMTPFVLAVLTIAHPRVNLPVMRVTAFVGILLGAVNALVWFVVNTWGWWMGILHIPLIVISLYAFVISLRKARA